MKLKFQGNENILDCSLVRGKSRRKRRSKSAHSKLRDEIKQQERMCYEYGLPLNREWEFLKFSYADGAFEKKGQHDLFKFSFPERFKSIRTSEVLRRALEGITPNVWVDISRRCKKLRMVSREPTNKSDLFDLKERLDRILKENRCPTKGICEKRTDIFMDLFDELIRQVAIDFCPEAGEILVQIRDHYRETLLLHRLIFQNSQAYAYRKQIPIKDRREEELKAEIDSILEREKELVEEMRCIERGIVLNQEKMFYKLVLKNKHYRQELNYYRVAIMRSLDLLDSCMPPEFRDALVEIRDRELEKKREEQKKEEERRKMEGEIPESEKSEEEEEEVEGEEEEVKGKGGRAMEDIVYRSDEEEVFEETTSEESEEGSSIASVMTPTQELDQAEELAVFRRLKALDGTASVTLSDVEKGEVKPFREPVVIIDEPEAVKEVKEEVKVEKRVEEEEEEPEEETESDKERARRRKLAEMGDDLVLEEEEKEDEEEEPGKAPEEKVEEEKPVEEEKETQKEEVQQGEKEDEEMKFKAEEIEEEAVEEELEADIWGTELEEEEEMEEEIMEEEEIFSSSSPSESEEEELAKKGPGKKREKARSTVIDTKDLVDVEMGETDTSELEDEEKGDQGSQAS